MEKEKKHHCFNCGEETEDYDELPNGKRIWVCNNSKCEKELRDTVREMESEARGRAQEDGYQRYY